MQALIDIGFRRVGFWRAVGGTVKLELTELADGRPALYAFAVDDRVRYVGKTAQPLKNRMYGYEKGASSQRTNIRVRGEIEKELSSGNRVDIWAFVSEDESNFGIFSLNVQAGLEDDIIRKLRPPWNGTVSSSPNPEQTPTRTDEATRKATAQAENDSRESFTVEIGSTYYRQGFFNVPVKYSEEFDADGKPISISLPNVSSPITGKINRSVNSNRTPRIMGGRLLRDWLQDNIGLGNRVRVAIHEKNRISISKG